MRSFEVRYNAADVDTLTRDLRRFAEAFDFGKAGASLCQQLRRPLTIIDQPTASY